MEGELEDIIRATCNSENVLCGSDKEGCCLEWRETDQRNED